MQQKSSATQLSLLETANKQHPAQLSRGIQLMIESNKRDRELGLKPYAVPLPLKNTASQ